MIRRKIALFLMLAVLLQAAVTVAALSLMRELTGNAEIARAIGRDLRRAEDFILYAGFASVSVLIAVAFTVRGSVRHSLRRFNAVTPDTQGTLFVDAEFGDELDSVARLVNEVSADASAIRARHRDEDDTRVKGEQFTQQVVGAMFDIVIVTDDEFRIVMANRAACELLGYSKLELIGLNIESIFEEQPFALLTPIRQLLLKNEMRDNEMTYRDRNGRLVPALVSASTLRNSVGAPVAIITVGKDITARKALERDLLEAKIAAESANRAKSAFVANMSHEIRTPMTAILGYAELLLRPDTLPEQRRLWLETIGRNGRHLLSVINDILDVSKIEAGRMTAERVDCSTTQIISDVIVLMRERAIDKGLKFDVRCLGSLPEKLQTDPVRLRQVLINLIGNAIKFTAAGAVQVCIAMTEARDGKPLLQFSVIDTGVGLTATQIDALFKPFVQADSSTTRKFGGTGLGLVITRKLVEMLGGEIAVRSMPSQGSTFAFTIRTGELKNVKMLDAPAFDLKTSEPFAPTLATGRAASLSGHVLLAEDGPDNRALIGFHLEEAGLRVTTVENGLLAVQAAQQAELDGQPFDIILMDMQMPELDGYSAATRLRTEGYRRPIVALTAHSLEGDRDKCIAAGCDDYAVKPIDQLALFTILARYLQPNTAVAPNDGAKPNAHQAALLARPASAKLLSRFVAGLPARLTAVESAMSRRGFEELGTLAHQLKGAAGGYGFPAVSDQAQQLETAAEARDAQAALAAVAMLRESCAAATRQFSSVAA